MSSPHQPSQKVPETPLACKPLWDATAGRIMFGQPKQAKEWTLWGRFGSLRQFRARAGLVLVSCATPPAVAEPVKGLAGTVATAFSSTRLLAAVLATAAFSVLAQEEGAFMVSRRGGTLVAQGGGSTRPSGAPARRFQGRGGICR